MHISFLCVRGVTTISSYSSRPPIHVESAFPERNSYSEILVFYLPPHPCISQHVSQHSVTSVAMDWISVSSQNYYVETQLWRGRILRGSFWEGVKVTWDDKVGAWSDRMSSLIKKTPRIVLSLQTPKEIMWAQRNMAAVCKPRGEASEWTLPGRHLGVNFQLPEMWGIHFCCFMFVVSCCFCLSHTVVVFCYGSCSRLIQVLSPKLELF